MTISFLSFQVFQGIFEGTLVIPCKLIILSPSLFVWIIYVRELFIVCQRKMAALPPMPNKGIASSQWDSLKVERHNLCPQGRCLHWRCITTAGVSADSCLHAQSFSNALSPLLTGKSLLLQTPFTPLWWTGCGHTWKWEKFIEVTTTTTKKSSQNQKQKPFPDFCVSLFNLLNIKDLEATGDGVLGQTDRQIIKLNG